MELLAGGELFDRVEKRGALTMLEAVTCMKQLLEGLEYLEKQGIVHRDIKPENCLFRLDSDDISKNTVVICDFGLGIYFTYHK